MMVITTRANKKYLNAHGVSCFDVTVKTDYVTLEEGFVGRNELIRLRMEFEGAINDINRLLDEDK